METAPDPKPTEKAPMPQPAPIQVRPPQALSKPAPAPVPAPREAAEKPRASQVPAWLKSLTILAALAIVGATMITMYSLSLARQLSQGVADALQPQIKYTTILSGAIGKLDNEAKLEVLSAQIDATVSSDSTSTFLGLGVGYAKAQITAPAQIRYYLLMKGIESHYDAAGKRFVVTIPHPQVDAASVKVDPDPAHWNQQIEFGWSPLSIFKDEQVRAEAKKHLEQAALEMGRHELLQDRADKNAKEALTDFIGKLTGNLQSEMKTDGIRLEVEFKK